MITILALFHASSRGKHISFHAAPHQIIFSKLFSRPTALSEAVIWAFC